LFTTVNFEKLKTNRNQEREGRDWKCTHTTKREEESLSEAAAVLLTT